MRGAEVFKAAGGYLPTFGIMGAVLGLIHTMSMLNEPTKLGEGIATAFVATLYGVGSANLIAYPVGKKIRARAHTEKEFDKIVITAINAIQSGQRGIALRQALTGGSSAAVSEPANSGALGRQGRQARRLCHRRKVRMSEIRSEVRAARSSAITPIRSG